MVGVGECFRNQFTTMVVCVGVPECGVCVYITCDYRVRYVGDVLNAVSYVCVRSVYGVVVWCRGVSWCYVYVGYGDVLEVFCVYF